MALKNRIKVRANGPLLCTGQVEVYAEDGYLWGKGENIALCRCGQSKNRPFCDGSHKEAEFENDGVFVGIESRELGPDAVLKIVVHENAGLLVTGPMTIESGDGSFSTTRNEAVMCRCGHSANKPFCDISHKEFDFEG